MQIPFNPLFKSKAVNIWHSSYHPKIARRIDDQCPAQSGHNAGQGKYRLYRSEYAMSQVQAGARRPIFVQNSTFELQPEAK